MNLAATQIKDFPIGSLWRNRDVVIMIIDAEQGFTKQGTPVIYVSMISYNGHHQGGTRHRRVCFGWGESMEQFYKRVS